MPTSDPEDRDQNQAAEVNDVPLSATKAEVSDAVSPSSTIDKPYSVEEQEDTAPKHKKISKIMRVLKGNTKAAAETALAIDHVRAHIGSDRAKGHLGVLPKTKNLVYAGPSEYKARYDGKKGWVYITDSVVRFSTKEHHDQSAPLIEIPLKYIKQLKRATAFAGKAAEVAADWGMEQELLGSVEIDDVEGKVHRFTALPERDELFNRLVAIGGHKWVNI